MCVGGDVATDVNREYLADSFMLNRPRDVQRSRHALSCVVETKLLPYFNALWRHFLCVASFVCVKLAIQQATKGHLVRPSWSVMPLPHHFPTNSIGIYLYNGIVRFRQELLVNKSLRVNVERREIWQ